MYSPPSRLSPSSASARATQKALTIAACAGLTAVAPLQAATIFDYRFDTGPAGASVDRLFDSGPNELHGSTVGLTFTDDTPPDGGSHALDATGDLNYAVVGHDDAMITQAFTLSLWARPDGVCYGPGDTCFLAIKKWNESGSFLASYGIMYTRTGHFVGEIGFGNYDGLQIASNDSFAVESGWHQVQLSLVRNVQGAQDRLVLTVDGQLQASIQRELPDLYFRPGDLVIGASNFSSAAGPYRRNFSGLIDEVTLSSVSVVPEPTVAALLGAGMAALLLGRRVRTWASGMERRASRAVPSFNP